MSFTSVVRVPLSSSAAGSREVSRSRLSLMSLGTVMASEVFMQRYQLRRGIIKYYKEETSHPGGS